MYIFIQYKKAPTEDYTKKKKKIRLAQTIIPYADFHKVAFNTSQLLITHYRGSKSSMQMSGFLKVMLHHIVRQSPVQVPLSVSRVFCDLSAAV